MKRVVYTEGQETYLQRQLREFYYGRLSGPREPAMTKDQRRAMVFANQGKTNSVKEVNPRFG
jgi:hypothetical protein